MLLVHRKNDGLSYRSGRVSLRLLEKGFAHELIACRGENLPLQVLNFKAFILLVDNNRPTLLRKSLGGDVRSYVENFWQAEKRPFRIFYGVDNVVPEGRQTRLASEVVIGVTKLPRFESLGVLGL